MIQILAVGYNAPIMEVVNRLIRNHGNWNGTIAQTKQEALARLSAGTYDVVLLCAGVTNEDEADFRQFMEAVLPDAKLVRHFGGGSGLLESEIRNAVDNKRTF